MNKLTWLVGCYRLVLIGAISFYMGVIPHAGYFPVNYTAQGNTVTVNPPQTFHSWGAWRGVGQFLTSSNYKIYVLNWRGQGGKVNIGSEFIHSVQKAQQQGKIIIFKLTGDAYSMHALAVCYASQVLQADQWFLMFHADGIESTGSRVSEARSNIRHFLSMCVFKHILSQNQVTKMWQGYEVYIKNGKATYIPDWRTLQ